MPIEQKFDDLFDKMLSERYEPSLDTVYITREDLVELKLLVKEVLKCIQP